MNRIIHQFWSGTKKGLKWIAIQYAVIVSLAILYYLGLLVYSLCVDTSIREVLMRSPHSFYTWQTGVLLAIPAYTMLFGWCKAFFPDRKHWWTYILSWLGFMLFFYLHVASGRNWDFQIISADEYMLGGWLAPGWGFMIQLIFGKPSSYFLCSNS